MSDYYMWAQDDFTSGEEQNLFKTSSTTAQKCQQFTESDSSSKWSSSESSTLQSQFEPGHSLNQSDSLFTSTFDNLNSQFSFKFTSKLKLKMIITQSDDPVSQENVVFNMFNNQNNSFKSDMNKQIELIKLRVQQLQLKLQIKKLAADLNFISNSFQSTFSVQFIWFDDRINNYRKEMTFKNSRLIFKLEKTHNYDV